MTTDVTTTNELETIHSEMKHDLIYGDRFMSAQLKIMCYLIEHAAADGDCVIEQKKIADAMDLTPATVSRTLLRLVVDHPDLIIRKTATHYQLHPDFMKQYSVRKPKID